MAEYNRIVAEGPTHICYSCDRLFFKKSITSAPRQKLIDKRNCSEDFLEKVILGRYLTDEIKIYQFCSTCKARIYENKIPRFNINQSGLAFPDITEEVACLTALEERLVAPRIPFMKIYALGCDRQHGLRAGVINVPVNVPKMFRTIPIRPEESQVIQLKLKRKLAYNSHYIYERIRPHVVYAAGQYLVETNLYKDHGVTLREDWPELDTMEFIVEPNDMDDTDGLPADDDTVPVELGLQEELPAELQQETMLDHDMLVDLLAEREIVRNETDQLEQEIAEENVIDGMISDMQQEEDPGFAAWLAENGHLIRQEVIEDEDPEYAAWMTENSHLIREEVISDGEELEDISWALRYEPHHAEMETEETDDAIENTNREPQDVEMEADAPANEEVLYEETMLDSNLLVEFAPGEGQCPLSLLLDKYCEELSFPTIWGGKARTSLPSAKLSYEDQILSEIMRSDRRAVRPDHLLFIHKKSQLKQLVSNVNIAMKKTGRTANITKEQALDDATISDYIAKDNAYRFLTNITGTPAYWEQQKKNLLGMVRQHGGFTIFVTLTAAETQWPELLKILKKTVDNEDDADVSDLSFEEKARLIRSDPVTCARYFEHRIKEVMKTWNIGEEGPFKKYKVKHIYYRIEFQHRGSPHLHGCVWLEKVPEYDATNPETYGPVEKFIDEIITTDSDDPAVQDVIKYQVHKCTHTCWKKSKGQKVCRFGAPFFPMDRTRILQPLPDDQLDEETKETCRNLIEKLRELLNGDLQAIGTFEEMLATLDCDIDLYVLAIRSQLTSDKVFIKRAPKNARINNYSPKILMLMRSNIDVQFVLNVYSCLSYIVEYINKPNRGISRLLRSCVESFASGNHTIREKLRAVSNTFYNGTEISAQEAAWCRLRLKMSKSSVFVEFVNTGPAKVRSLDLEFQHYLLKHFLT
jgi:hypothetical protein